MVAITVILAAVIGTFVLGLGDQVQNTTPQASFGFDQTTETVTNSTVTDVTTVTNSTVTDVTTVTNSTVTDVTTVTVTHESGDSIAETDLAVRVGGNAAWSLNNTGSAPQAVDPWSDSNQDVTAGSSFQVYLYDSDGTVSEGSNVDVDGSGYTLPTGATALASGDVVQVIYNSPDSDSSSTLAKYEVQ